MRRAGTPMHRRGGRSTLRIPALLIAAAMVAFAPRADDAFAQISYGGGPQAYQSIAPAYIGVDFTFDGGELPESSFEFVEPVWGIVYSRPGFSFSAARGVQDASDSDDLTLIDVLLLGYGAFTPFRSETRAFELLVPVGLSSGYRKVSRNSASSVIQAFEFTTFSIGAGLGLGHRTEKTNLLIRAMPFYGLATRSIGNENGSTATFDTDVELGLGPFSDRIGVTLGYGFRWQKWNLKASALFEGISDETFDYSGTMHTFRVGVLF
ncbi:MAG: hypothetical protein HKN17_07575 [Rhodothermales bacterium]|nr:hypothetical protein [Rhodothermales bacterium]